MHSLILMSDTGGGHRALSRAIAAGLDETSQGSDQSSLLDPFMTAGERLPGMIMRQYGPLIRRFPGLYGVIYHFLDVPGRYATIARTLGRSVVQKIVDAAIREQSDVLIIAHPLAVESAMLAIEDIRKKTGRTLPSIAMVTELVSIHWSWIDKRITRYFAATEEIQRGLVHRGVDASRITLTGLPVGPAFGRITESQAETRRRLRLNERRTTALVLAGGEGGGPVEHLVPRLSKALPDLQIMVVCGRNTRLKSNLESYGLPPTTQIYGFADNMAELMHASDFVLTKGGPQTLSEALAAARPVVVTDLLPGQEQGNGAYIVRHGAGYLALTQPEILAAARRLFDDPSERARLSKNAHEIGHRAAAARVANEVRINIAAANHVS